MTEPASPHTRRKRRARFLLCFTFVVLTGAHYLFYRFSVSILNPYPVTRGLTFGLTLWTTALLLAMWLRRSWARYVIIALLVISILVYGLTALMMTSQSVDSLSEPVHAALGGILLYMIALIPLGISRSLRHFLAPRTAGGQ